MEEKIKEKLLLQLNQLLEKTVDGAEFVLGKLPDIAHAYIVFLIAQASLGMLIPIGWIFLFMYMWRKSYVVGDIFTGFGILINKDIGRTMDDDSKSRIKKAVSPIFSVITKVIVSIVGFNVVTDTALWRLERIMHAAISPVTFVIKEIQKW